MGTPVTVDSDDLEAALLAAELGARVSEETHACTSDVAYKRRSPTMREACDRLRRQRGDAIRPADNPYENAPPTPEQLVMMAAIRDEGGVLRIESLPEWQPLILRRLVVAGVGNFYITWGDKTKTATTDTRQYVRLTEKGLSWLAKNLNLLANPRSSPTSELPSAPGGTARSIGSTLGCSGRSTEPDAE